MNIPIIYDHKLHKIRLENNKKKFFKHNFLHEYSAHNLLNNISSTTKKFVDILEIGHKTRTEIKNIIKDKLHYKYTLNLAEVEYINNIEYLSLNKKYDLIISNLILHNINDLPGYLMQINNSLKENGVFLASIFGGNSLYELKNTIINTEIMLNFPPSPHVSPFIDIKTMGMLLQRAKFDLIVTDIDNLTIEYQSLKNLLADIRGMSENNILTTRVKKYLTKNFIKMLHKNYINNFSNKNSELIATVEIINIMGTKK